MPLPPSRAHAPPSATDLAEHACALLLRASEGAAPALTRLSLSLADFEPLPKARQEGWARANSLALTRLGRCGRARLLRRAQRSDRRVKLARVLFVICDGRLARVRACPLLFSCDCPFVFLAFSLRFLRFCSSLSSPPCLFTQ
eukprot:3447238-Pleurochrysis_carterae.AAC.1